MVLRRLNILLRRRRPRVHGSVCITLAMLAFKLQRKHWTRYNEQRETFCAFPDLLYMLILQFIITTTITISCANHCSSTHLLHEWIRMKRDVTTLYRCKYVHWNECSVVDGEHVSYALNCTNFISVLRCVSGMNVCDSRQFVEYRWACKAYGYGWRCTST